MTVIQTLTVLDRILKKSRVLMDIYTSMDRRTVLFDIIADDAVVFVAYLEDD